MPRLLSVLLASASLAVLGARQQPTSAAEVQSQPPRPTFRSGVDLVPIDVVVLDRDRLPVKGLRAEDFTVTENDDLQAIETFEAVDVPEPEGDAAGWMREVAPDVVSNDIQARRLVVIVLDDGNMSVEHGESKSAREIANTLIDGLGPSDLAAVVCTFQGRVENFTTDRQKLRAAVEAFKPHGGALGCELRPGGCAVDTLSRIADTLRTAPGGRKLLAFISPRASTGGEFWDRPDEFNGLGAVQTMLANLQLANVSVYSYDPRGLRNAPPSTNEIGLAEATGGRRVTATNTPEAYVGQMFHESSYYYLIGYRTTHARADRRFRRISVRVNRPGLEVRTRTGYFGLPAPKKKPRSGTVVQQVDQVIQQAFPVSDLAVRAVTTALAGRDGKTGALVSVLALRESAPTESTSPPAAAPKKRVDVVVAAFDMQGRSKGVYRQTIQLTLRPGARSDSEYEVMSRMSLAPGRYEVRIAAVVDGRGGSVFTTVEIPRFAKDPLSLSGIVFEKRPGALGSSRVLVADLLPVTPTAARTFGPDEQAAAFLRVYQGDTRPLGPVTIAARLTDAHDVERKGDTWQLLPEAFGRERTADVTWSLTGEGLAPGEYLLTFEATSAGGRAVQHARFRVQIQRALKPRAPDDLTSRGDVGFRNLGTLS